MFFRNLTFFRFPTSISKSFDNIDAALTNAALKPVGMLETSSRGFVSPFGRDEPAMSHRIGDCIWLTVGGEDKVLPSSVVNDALTKKIAEIEGKEGRKLGGRARKRLKEELVHSLLTRAFVRPMRLNASLDLKQGVVAVDTSSRKAAEGFISDLRHSVGSFPALPLNAEVAPRSVLTGWISGEPLPQGLALGDACELRDPIDGGSCWKGSEAELGGEEVRQHLEAGKQVTRLALVFDDHLSFVLDERLVIRKLKFLDDAVESLENTERDSLHAELDARYALMSGELKRLFTVLESALKLSKVDG